VTIANHRELGRPSFGRSKKERGGDWFDTPPIALDPLFAHEPLLTGVTAVCEPFCGKGNLVTAMRARGLTVHASDILDRGCPDSTVLDFLDMTSRPPGCDVLVSNCAYANAMGFIEHAITLRFRVIVLLLPVDFLCTADRFRRLHEPGHLCRVHVLAERLQGMHDAAHLAAGGKKAGQSQKHAWFVFDRDYRGPATVNPISLHHPDARMPWSTAMKTPIPREQKALADDAKLLKAWTAWHKEQLDKALAGPHGAVVAQVMTLLKQMDTISGAAMVAAMRGIDWGVVDYDTRLTILHQVHQAIARLRERAGLPPFDDPLPGQPTNVFQRVRQMLLAPTPTDAT
jgi:hypothetical protein